MIKKVGESFLLAFQNIRARFFHTLLSVLGIVIGVAALVAILSLIDGMEKYAKEQIATTTSLNGIVVHSVTQKRMNNVSVRKDSFAVIDYAGFEAVRKRITKPATFYLRSWTTDQIALGDSLKPVGVVVYAMGSGITPQTRLVSGRLFTEEDIVQRVPSALVNRSFAAAALKDSASVIGVTVVYKNRTLRVSGVYRNGEETSPSIVLPFTLLSAEEVVNNPPELYVDVASTLDVNPVKEEIIAWLKHSFPGDEFSVSTNRLRLEQAERGFTLFRVIMGMIVGLSVLVGGIGVMNVLLISVTQRTVEIGVRKAVGANRRDIILQFLAESITVSAFGSLLGLVLGVLAARAAEPVITAMTGVHIQAAYTLDTLMVIATIALVIGIVFGTYPAMRASRLDPVEAIRKE